MHRTLDHAVPQQSGPAGERHPSGRTASSPRAPAQPLCDTAGDAQHTPHAIPILRQQMAPPCQVSLSRCVFQLGSSTDCRSLQPQANGASFSQSFCFDLRWAEGNSASTETISLSGLWSCVSNCISEWCAEGAYHRVRHVLVGYVPLGVGVAQRKEAVRVLQTA